MVEVEHLDYQLPRDGYLDESYLGNRLELGQFDFLRLEETINRRGFTELKPLPTELGSWRVWERRPGVWVRNFSQGDVYLESMLGLYQQPRLDAAINDRQIVLWNSTVSPVRPKAFRKDLTQITRHYLERKLISSFPSRLSRWSAPYLMLFGAGLGVGLGLTAPVEADLWQQVYRPLDIAIGMSVGALAGLALSWPVYSLGERRARSSITHRKEYLAGESAFSNLIDEENHHSNVLVQRELYKSLLKEDPKLTPLQFLVEVYLQLPRRLLEGRINQWKEGQVGREYEETASSPDSFNNLLEISRIIRRSAIPLVVGF